MVESSKQFTWTPEIYKDIHDIVFAPGYPGYRPETAEVPNGDGRVDWGKRYSHIAPKYGFDHGPPQRLLATYSRAMCDAYTVCLALGLPLPGKDSTLRVLEYPVGVGGEEHTDFDMFTLSLYRSHPDALVVKHSEEDGPSVKHVRERFPRIHMGELATEFKRIPADSHHIEARPEVQYSAVFFALPDLDAPLLSGQRAGDWLAERYKRSRVKR